MARILVVDDEQANRQMVVTILRGAGHSVEAASNGAVALSHLETGDWDLLITDMHMPVMDGVELISQCRGLHPGLPVIAISGGNFAGDTSRLADAGLMGAIETVSKPYKVEDLISAVERALGAAEPGKI
ncbi:MAG: response regulator [bacterium]|nr:response regulator [bacterium]